MSHCSQTLSDQIEQLVREHIESTRRAAAEAVERAFASSSAAPRASAARSQRRAPSRRRGPDEIAALGERLYAAVVAEPGETMTVLAPTVGETPREQHRPRHGDQRVAVAAGTGRLLQRQRAGRARGFGSSKVAHFCNGAFANFSFFC